MNFMHLVNWLKKTTTVKTEQSSSWQSGQISVFATLSCRDCDKNERGAYTFLSQSQREGVAKPEFVLDKGRHTLEVFISWKSGSR